MTRSFVILACLSALGMAVPMGSAVEAKTCVAKSMDGKQTKWKCSAKQKCCYDWLTNKGSCVAASSICI